MASGNLPRVVYYSEFAKWWKEHGDVNGGNKKIEFAAFVAGMSEGSRRLITKDQDFRLRRAFGTMRYGALAKLEFPLEKYDLDTVIKNIERLQSVLVSVCDQNELDMKELNELRAEKAVVQKYFGVKH